MVPYGTDETEERLEWSGRQRQAEGDEIVQRKHTATSVFRTLIHLI